MSSHSPGDFDSLMAAIAQRHGTLSARLRQIAEFALANPVDMALDTVAVIAAKATVQPSAVIRFAQAFGFGGFSEMQALFRDHLVRQGGTYLDRIRDIDDNNRFSDTHAILTEISQAGASVLADLPHRVSAASLEGAVGLLRRSDMIGVVGMRRSYPVATYLTYCLGNLGCRATLIDGGGGMSRYQERFLTKADALIVISFRPYAPEALEVVRSASGRGIPVLCLTDSQVSPLVPLSREVLIVDDIRVHGFQALAATMCVVLALVVALGKQIHKASMVE